MLNSIAHVSFLVANTQRALIFYCDVLGLKQNPGRPDLGYPGVWLDVGVAQIHLLELPNPEPVEERPVHGGRGRHVAFGVADLNAVAAVLEKGGVMCTRSRSGRRALFCRDPDGNALEFIEESVVNRVLL
jgi:glyoxylase I family protein